MIQVPAILVPAVLVIAGILALVLYLDKRDPGVSETPGRDQASAAECAANSLAWATWVLAWATLVIAALTCAIFAAGVAQYLTFDKQLTVMQGQLSVMNSQLGTAQNDQRPWLRARVAAVEPFILTDSAIAFGITIQFVNSAKSPAFDVEQYSNFFALDYPRLLIHQADQCNFTERMSRSDHEKRRTGILRGFAIFPGEDTSPQENFPFSSPDIHQFDQIETGGKTVLFLAPVLIGCVAYRQTGVDAYRHTWYSIEIGKKGPDGNFTRITPGAQRIERADVLARFSLFGQNTAD
jgi:hypothetical protein